MALTADGRLLALDAKMVIDDSSWFRQPLAEWRDRNEEGSDGDRGGRKPASAPT